MKGLLLTWLKIMSSSFNTVILIATANQISLSLTLRSSAEQY